VYQFLSPQLHTRQKQQPANGDGSVMLPAEDSVQLGCGVLLSFCRLEFLLGVGQDEWDGLGHAFQCGGALHPSTFRPRYYRGVGGERTTGQADRQTEGEREKKWKGEAEGRAK
jgi:hypothetical protein